MSANIEITELVVCIEFDGYKHGSLYYGMIDSELESWNDAKYGECKYQLCRDRCVNCYDVNTIKNEDGRDECVNCEDLNFEESHDEECNNRTLDEFDIDDDESKRMFAFLLMEYLNGELSVNMRFSNYWDYGYSGGAIYATIDESELDKLNAYPLSIKENDPQHLSLEYGEDIARVGDAVTGFIQIKKEVKDNA